MNDVFVQYGALGGVVVFAFLAIKVMYAQAQKSYDRERERADRLEIELRQLNELVRTQYVTTLSEATRAIADALAAMRRG